MEYLLAPSETSPCATRLRSSNNASTKSVDGHSPLSSQHFRRTDLAKTTSDIWQPVVRVGVPKFIAGIGSRIKVELKTKGWLSRDWRGYFRSAVSQQDLDASYASFLCWDEIQSIEGSCVDDDAEHYVEMIDAAIHYANTKFQSEALLKLGAREKQRYCAVDPVRKRQAALDDLATKLAKPE
jgi:hypothetical protein